MKILYNPPTGAKIERFVFEGTLLPPFLPGELMQYDDPTADELLTIYGFLMVKTPEAAKKIMEDKNKKYQCDICDFASDEEIALEGHKRSHVKKGELDQEAVEGIPVAQGKRILDSSEVKRVQAALERGEDLPDGIDKDGVTWYGGGVVVENKAFSRVRPVGHGHFKPE